MHAFLAEMQLRQQKMNDFSVNMCDFLVQWRGFFLNVHMIILAKICDFWQNHMGCSGIYM